MLTEMVPKLLWLQNVLTEVPGGVRIDKEKCSGTSLVPKELAHFNTEVENVLAQSFRYRLALDTMMASGNVDLPCKPDLELWSDLVNHNCLEPTVVSRKTTDSDLKNIIQDLGRVSRLICRAWQQISTVAGLLLFPHSLLFVLTTDCLPSCEVSSSEDQTWKEYFLVNTNYLLTGEGRNDKERLVNRLSGAVLATKCGLANFETVDSHLKPLTAEMTHKDKHLKSYEIQQFAGNSLSDLVVLQEQK